MDFVSTNCPSRCINNEDILAIGLEFITKSDVT